MHPLLSLLDHDDRRPAEVEQCREGGLVHALPFPGRLDPAPHRAVVCVLSREHCG